MQSFACGAITQRLGALWRAVHGVKLEAWYVLVCAGGANLCKHPFGSMASQEQLDQVAALCT